MQVSGLQILDLITIRSLPYVCVKRWARAVILAAVVVGCVLFLPFLRPSLQGSNALQTQAVRYDAKDGDLAMDGPSQHLEAEEPDGRNIDNIREDYRLARGSNGGEQAANSSGLTQRHTERQQAVVEMFRHAWKGYTQFAWGKDELLPLTKKGTTSYGMGLTIIDSLDTMWLMGLTEEFQKARDWVAQSLDIAGNHREVSLFETNIRVLGGLLAAYHLSNDGIFLEKAVSFVGYGHSLKLGVLTKKFTNSIPCVRLSWETDFCRLSKHPPVFPMGPWYSTRTRPRKLLKWPAFLSWAPSSWR